MHGLTFETQCHTSQMFLHNLAFDTAIEEKAFCTGKNVKCMMNILKNSFGKIS